MSKNRNLKAETFWKYFFLSILLVLFQIPLKNCQENVLVSTAIRLNCRATCRAISSTTGRWFGAISAAAHRIMAMQLSTPKTSSTTTCSTIWPMVSNESRSTTIFDPFGKKSGRRFCTGGARICVLAISRSICYNWTIWGGLLRHMKSDFVFHYIA